MTLKWISLPRVEGIASRQAHADLPPGAYERELGREGFYGPSTQMVHRHPPTGWTGFEGPLRPRAFDTAELAGTCASPWDAVPILGNEHLRLRVWHTSGAMDH
ncbi:MAG: homogentisate 1,2-dioxygenase, partial [Betaproteobacteria bacterium]|nr:homogentisate 1,2-dioxygenase [Betaproteobacteria bacterium]